MIYLLAIKVNFVYKKYEHPKYISMGCSFFIKRVI